MPILTFWLLFLRLKLRIFIQLQNKSNLSRHTKIRCWQNGHLLYKTLSRKLRLISLNIQHLTHFYRLNLHYVPNIDILNPLRLVQVPQHCSHVRLITRLNFLSPVLLILLSLLLFIYILHLGHPRPLPRSRRLPDQALLHRIDHRQDSLSCFLDHG